MIVNDLNMVAFRGMTEVHLERLGPVSVFVGANNSGKTSILESVALLLRPLDPAQWIQVAKQRDSDAAFLDGLWAFFPSVTPLQLDDGPKETQKLMVSGTIGGEKRSFSAIGSANPNWDMEGNGGITLRIDVSVNDLEPHTMEFRREIPAEYGKGVPFFRCFTVTSATHRSTRNFVEHLSKVIDEGEKPVAVDILRLFDSDISDVDISATRGRDGVRVTHAKRGIVDISSFGDGMRRAAVFALALARAKAGVLLIDELEAGIHPQILPEVLRRLFEAANAFDVQILATTHSLEAIDALIAALNDTNTSVAGYYLQQNETSKLVQRYGREKLIQLREMGFDIR